MKALVSIAILLIGAFGIWSINGLFRNARVNKERLRILTAIGAAAQTDIEAGRDWMWRYEMFNNAPSHVRMVMEIWKPVSSYLPELEKATQLGRS